MRKQITSAPAEKKQRRPSRHHSPEKKRQIVEEALAPGAHIPEVADRYDVCRNLIYTWRDQYFRGKFGEPVKGASLFIPVGVIGGDGRIEATSSFPSVDSDISESLDAISASASPCPASAAMAEAASPPASPQAFPPVIILSLAGGAQLRFEGSVEPALMRCAMEVALGRV